MEIKQEETAVLKQKRSKETQKKLMDAGAKLLAEKGYHHTNSKEIARMAGVSIGSFYTYFKDKKELFKQVLISKKEHLIRTISLPLINEKTGQMNRKELFLFLFNEALNSNEFTYDLHKEFHNLISEDKEFKKIRDEWCEQEQKVIYNILKKYEDELRIKDLNIASVILNHVVENIYHLVKSNKEKSENKIIIKEVVDMLYRYLFKESEY